MVALHLLNSKLLNGNYAKLIHDSAGVLVDKVVTSVSDSLVNTTYNLLGSMSFVGAPDAFGKLALCFGKGFFFTTKEAGTVDERSIRQGGKLLKPNVDTDRFTRIGEGLRLSFISETNEPLIPVSENGAGLNLTDNRPMNFSFNRSNLAEGDIIAVDRKTKLGIREGIVPIALESGESGLLSASLDPTKESLKRKINTHSNILQDLRVNGKKFRMALLPLRKFGGLVVIGQGLAMRLIVMLSAIQKAVVDLPTGLKRGLHFRGLCFGREESVF